MGKRLLSFYQIVCTMDLLKFQGSTDVPQDMMDMRVADQMHL